mgnify:FL=1
MVQDLILLPCCCSCSDYHHQQCEILIWTVLCHFYVVLYQRVLILLLNLSRGEKLIRYACRWSAALVHPSYGVQIVDLQFSGHNVFSFSAPPYCVRVYVQLQSILPVCSLSTGYLWYLGWDLTPSLSVLSSRLLSDSSRKNLPEWLYYNSKQMKVKAIEYSQV